MLTKSPSKDSKMLEVCQTPNTYNQQKILSSQLPSFFLLQVALALRGVTSRVSRISLRGPTFLTGKVNIIM